MNDSPDEFLTPNEAAREWKRDPQTIRKMVREGRLQGYKLGRNIRIRRSDLTAAMVAYR